MIDPAIGETVRNAHVQPLAGLDVPWLVSYRAETHGDKPFLIWEPFEGPTGTPEPRAWSFAEFKRDTEALAAGLVARGIKPGDFVLIHLENCPETTLAWYACARMGAIAVTTNTRAAEAEVAYFAENCGAVAGITQPKFASMLRRAAPQLRWIAVTETDCGAAGTEPVPGDMERFPALHGDPASVPYRPTDPMAPVSVQFTSGTTSRPKGVLWTHANAIWGAKINATHELLRADDVHMVQMPLFHTNAQIYSVMAALWVGASAVVVPRFSASRFWDISLKHGCTWASMIPFFTKALMERPVPAESKYRMFGMGAVAPAINDYFRVQTVAWWGMTETMTHGIVSDPTLPQRAGAIGRPAPEYEIAVLHDDGTPCEPGETGNLFIRGIRGLSLFAEYLNNPQATRDAFDDQGFFATGDRVTVHADGFIQFADRAKDMLRVGAENVAASEIEAIILTVPGVREVAVVGRKHPMLDEVPHAFVLVDTGYSTDDRTLADQVIATCREQLADFKVPRAVDLVDDLPRATLEKIAKAELRKRLPPIEA